MNNLIVKGNKKDLEKLLKFVRGVDETGNILYFDFEKVLPTPQALLDTTSPCNDKKKTEKNLKEYGAKDWYEWRVNNWGTKSNTDNEVVISKPNDTGTELNFSFNTAWTPPIGIIRKLGKRYTKIYFCLYYFEPGTAFSGKFIMDKGEEEDIYYEGDKEYLEVAREGFGSEFVDEMVD